MSEDLTPRQQILLWDLISRGGSALQKDLKPEVKPADRELLVRARMISVAKVNRALQLSIEDGGWARVASTAPTLLKAGEGSKYDRPILQFVLAKTQAFAAAKNIAFAEIFAEGRSDLPEKTGGDSIPSRPLSIEDAICSAFFEIAGRPARDGVRLNSLREKLKDIGRSELDATLLQMRSKGTANLMNMDNPRDIEAVGDAALKAGNQTFHILWIDS